MKYEVFFRNFRPSSRRRFAARYAASGTGAVEYTHLAVYPLAIPKISYDDDSFSVSQRIFWLEMFENKDGSFGLFARDNETLAHEDMSSYEEWKSLLAFPPLARWSFHEIIEVFVFFFKEHV